MSSLYITLFRYQRQSFSISHLQNWKIPLQRSAESVAPIISQQEIESIFSILEVISAVHSGFLNDLEPKIHNWDDRAILSSAFLKLVLKLKVSHCTCTVLMNVIQLYKHYINNYDKSVQTLNSCMQRKPFQQFCNEIHKKSMNKLDLQSYLIM